jgi:hypothetical protein
VVAVTRRPFTAIAYFGRRVGTPAEVAADLGVPLEEVTRAIEAADLDPWGRNARGERVWSMTLVRRALGRPEPPRVRGGSWRGRPIAGSRGRRRRRDPEELLELEEDAT